MEKTVEVAAVRPADAAPPKDVAPTIATWLNVAQPSGSIGTVLEEVIRRR